MGEIDFRHLQVFARNIFPYVELGPIANGKYTNVFAGMYPGIIEIPQFGALILGIPLTKFIPERKYAFLGPSLFLVAARPADTGIKPEFRNGVQQCHRLKWVAALFFRAQYHSSLPDGVFHAAHD